MEKQILPIVQRIFGRWRKGVIHVYDFVWVSKLVQLCLNGFSGGHHWTKYGFKFDYIAVPLLTMWIRINVWTIEKQYIDIPYIFQFLYMWVCSYCSRGKNLMDFFFLSFSPPPNPTPLPKRSHSDIWVKSIAKFKQEACTVAALLLG